MNTILVVDDERTLNLDATHVRTKREAKKFILSHPEPIELWLDHDLGDDGDVMELVNWLEEKIVIDGLDNIHSVIVHSMNPTAYNKILLALGRYVDVMRVDVTKYIDWRNLVV